MSRFRPCDWIIRSPFPLAEISVLQMHDLITSKQKAELLIVSIPTVFVMGCHILMAAILQLKAIT